MIPTVLALGLVVGFLPPRHWHAKLLAVAVIATAWATLIGFTQFPFADVSGAAAIIGAWLLAAANAAVAIAPGAAMWALVARIRRPATA